MLWVIGLILLLALFLSGSKTSKVQYGVASKTLNGEKVRSKAEKHIANYLSSRGISYEYETPVKSKGWLGGKKISNPDFYLPEYNVYVEYWGLVDADDRRVREKYIRTMKWKMKQYYENGIKFVSIYPSNLSNLDWVFRKKFEKVTGYTLPH